MNKKTHELSVAQIAALQKHDEDCRAGKYGEINRTWLAARDVIALRDGDDPCTVGNGIDLGR